MLTLERAWKSWISQTHILSLSLSPFLPPPRQLYCTPSYSFHPSGSCDTSLINCNASAMTCDSVKLCNCVNHLLCLRSSTLKCLHLLDTNAVSLTLLFYIIVCFLSRNHYSNKLDLNITHIGTFLRIITYLSYNLNYIFLQTLLFIIHYIEIPQHKILCFYFKVPRYVWMSIMSYFNTLANKINYRAKITQIVRFCEFAYSFRDYISFCKVLWYLFAPNILYTKQLKLYNSVKKKKLDK